MKKRSFRLLCMLGAFGVLLGGYGILSHFTQQEDTAETADTITVAAVEEDQVTAISWTYQGETISLSQQDNGGWVNTEDEAMPIDKDKVEEMLSSLQSVVSTRSIENPENLSDYGLEDPACSINVTEQDGTVLAFSIGDYNSVSGQYYLLYQDTVYLVDSTLLSAYSVSQQELIAYETLPDLSDTSSISIASGSSQLQLVHETEGMEAYTYNTDAYTWFSQQEDSYTPLSTSAVNDLKSKITGMSFLSCESWNADADSLVEYGLSQPAGTVTVAYLEDTEDEDSTEEPAEQTLTLLLGDYTEDGCYVMLEGSKMVYTIDSTTADALLLASVNELLPTKICLIPENTVTSMEITLDGVSSEITLTHEETTDEDGETSTETISISSGVTLDQDAVDAAFESLQSLESQGTAASDAGQREPVLSITFHRNTETYSELTLTFSTYDSANYLVTFQGESRMLASKSDVRNLMDLLETALNSTAEEDSTAEAESAES